VIGPYGTPQAFRAALQARLRHIAHTRGADLQRLQRQVAFERLLARLFSHDDPPWLLKGGYALELRLPDRSRSTLDLDLSVPEPERLWLSADVADGDSPVQVYACLQQAADRDLGDGFEFLIRQPTGEQTGAPGGGMRCSVEARLAGRPFARFHVDVGLGDPVLDQPDWVGGSALLSFAGIPAARVALYPLAQQFAEKIHAYTFPWQDRDNTRVKDLVDLVLLIHSGQVEPERARRALRATFETRATHPLPLRLPPPPQDWVEPYAALARELGLPASTLPEAYAYLAGHWAEWALFTANALHTEKDVH
jgi:hypothetical protein